jgi:hypothetical protein
MNADVDLIPKRLAIVIGDESYGVSISFRRACHARVRLPMFGMCDSFSVSVAAALLLERLFALCPEARGDLSKEERDELRQTWFLKLAKTERQKKLYLDYWIHHIDQIAPFEGHEDNRIDEATKIARINKKVLRKLISMDETYESIEQKNKSRKVSSSA